jgi:epsin
VKRSSVRRKSTSKKADPSSPSQKVADLFSFDDDNPPVTTSATASSNGQGKQAAVPTSLDGDDDFDDFQSAPSSTPAVDSLFVTQSQPVKPVISPVPIPTLSSTLPVTSAGQGQPIPRFNTLSAPAPARPQSITTPPIPVTKSPQPNYFSQPAVTPTVPLFSHCF